MILERISKAFNSIDTVYSELYEKQVAFEENPTHENKEELLKSYEKLKPKLYYYKAIVKNWYPGERR
jgi:hypothetical protein